MSAWDCSFLLEVIGTCGKSKGKLQAADNFGNKLNHPESRRGAIASTTTKMAVLHSDIPSAIASRAASTFRNVHSSVFSSRSAVPHTFSPTLWPSITASPVRLITKAFSNGAGDVVEKFQEKPSICTADEVHYVSVSKSDWRLALWRYTPSPEVFFTFPSLQICFCAKKLYLINLLDFFFP